MQVLFLLLLLLFLLKCCLSKSPYSDLHFDYPSFSHISYSLRVILDWKFFFEKNPLLLTFVRNFHMINLLKICSPHAKEESQDGENHSQICFRKLQNNFSSPEIDRTHPNWSKTNRVRQKITSPSLNRDFFEN